MTHDIYRCGRHLCLCALAEAAEEYLANYRAGNVNQENAFETVSAAPSATAGESIASGDLAHKLRP